MNHLNPVRFLGLAAAQSVVLAGLWTGAAHAGDAASKEQDCTTLAAIAEKASALRKDGVSKDAATAQLTDAHAGGSARVTKALSGVVAWSYMAKLSPSSAASYYKKQCLMN